MNAFATTTFTAVRTSAVITLVVIIAAASQAPVTDAAYAEVMTALSCAVGSQGRSSGIALRAEDLNDYGCFCGAEMVNVAMAGEPVDAIDACCMHHNTCWYGIHTHTHTYTCTCTERGHIHNYTILRAIRIVTHTHYTLRDKTTNTDAHAFSVNNRIFVALLDLYTHIHIQESC